VVVDPVGTEHVWHVTYRNGNWQVLRQDVTLQPDTPYVYEADVRSTTPVVSMYWLTDIGRHLEDTTYRDWTRVRYVFITPHWNGPMRAQISPVLMKALGDAWIKNVGLAEFKAPDGR